MQRYFVDKRNGCVAVRDRHNTDPEYDGLHADTEGVVAFWTGSRKDYCWEVPDVVVNAAQAFCDELNKQEEENMQRYFVDSRETCIAVRDRLNTDPGDTELHPDTKGVVKFWYETWIGGKKESKIRTAQAFCDKMNKEEEGNADES